MKRSFLMTVNIYDTINQLERELKETDEFKHLEEAYESVMADEQAKEIWQNFQDYQRTLQQKQRAGEEMTPEDFQEFQKLSAEMAGNELTANFIEAERGLYQIFTDVNRALEKPILKFYQDQK